MNRPLFALTLCAILTAACGSDPDEATAQPEEAPGQSASTTSDHQEIPPMSAQDGWVDLHDVALPHPGQAVLTVGGTQVELEINCHGPGEIDADADLPSVMASRLFNAQFQGEGKLANGRQVRVSGYRRVVDPEEARRDLRYYRYPGQDRASLDVTIIDENGLAHSSFQGGPNDMNRDGKGLPMLHVQADGSFTAVTELISAATMIPGTHDLHKDALAGETTLAGRCPTPWQDQPLPGGMRALF